MQRWKTASEFKRDTDRLVLESSVSIAQAARDLDIHRNVLRKWVKEFSADPGQAFPGNRQMRPEHLGDRAPAREAKLKVVRDILNVDTYWVCATKP